MECCDTPLKHRPSSTLRHHEIAYIFVDVEGRSAQNQHVCNFCSYVKIAVLRGRNAKKCHSELTEALGNRALPYRTVTRWAAALQRGRVTSASMRRIGRPRTMRTDVARAVIAQCLEDDRRWSLQELQAHTGIDQATVHKILREDLHMRKIAAKWVPHALTKEKKMMSL